MQQEQAGPLRGGGGGGGVSRVGAPGSTSLGGPQAKRGNKK